MRWPILRDIALFFGGMAGVVHETLLTGSERPTLLILFAAMMGLPAFLQGPSAGTEAASRALHLPGRLSAAAQAAKEAEEQEALDRQEIADEVARALEVRKAKS